MSVLLDRLVMQSAANQPQPTNQLSVDRTFCNLEKAFDCINHDILLSKVEVYGIRGKMNALIKSHLNDRYKRLNK
jgi:hypothetical protein